jgi:hypothetical protein
MMQKGGENVELHDWVIQGASCQLHANLAFD